MFLDPPDYDEIEAERREYEQEQMEEWRADNIECPITKLPRCEERSCDLHYMEAPLRLPPNESTDDFYTYNSRVTPKDDDYEDDPDDHPLGCNCFLCVPGSM